MRILFFLAVVSFFPFVTWHATHSRLASSNGYVKPPYPLQENGPGSFVDSSLRVYLTFDDGISPETAVLDSITRKDSIPVTVFLIGKKLKTSIASLETYTRIRQNPWIAIGNHSYSHANGHYRKYYRQPGVVVADVLANQDSLQLTSKLLRLPGRNIWRLGGKKRQDLADAIAAADSLSSIGFDIIGWDCEWQYDSSARQYYTAAQMVSLLQYSRSYFHPGQVVILCHDPMLKNPGFVNELHLFVNMLRSCGAGFETLYQYTQPNDAVLQLDSQNDKDFPQKGFMKKN